LESGFVSLVSFLLGFELSPLPSIDFKRVLWLLSWSQLCLVQATNWATFLSMLFRPQSGLLVSAFYREQIGENLLLLWPLPSTLLSSRFGN